MPSTSSRSSSGRRSRASGDSRKAATSCAWELIHIMCISLKRQTASSTALDCSLQALAIAGTPAHPVQIRKDNTLLTLLLLACMQVFLQGFLLR